MLLTVVINRNDKILNRNVVNIFGFDTTHFITSIQTHEKSKLMGSISKNYIFFTVKRKISPTFTTDREEEISIYLLINMGL